MNQTTRKTVTPPPTLTPIPRSGIPGFAGILLYILVGLSALMLPLCASILTGTSFPEPLIAEGLCLLYLLLLAVYFNRTAKLTGKISRGITPLMVAFACFMYFAFRTLVPAVFAFAFIFIIGEGSLLYATAGKRQLWATVLVPAIAFALSLILVHTVDVAVISLLPFPASVALALGTRSSASREEGLTRVGVICAASLTLGVTLAAYALWIIHQALGTLEITALQEALESLRATLIQLMKDFDIMYGDQVLISFTDKEEIIVNAVNSAINTLPGALVVVITVSVTLSQVIALSGLQAYGFGASLSPRVRTFRISPVSAAVFMISWLVALFAVGENSASTVAGTVAENFYIILMPGLALAGTIRLLGGITRKGGMGCNFFLFIIIPCLLLYLPPVFALCEAMLLVFAPMLKKIKSKKKDSDDTTPPESPGKPTAPLSDEELFDRYCREQQKKRDEDRDSHDDHDGSQ